MSSDKSSLSRRSFMKWSAAAAGAMAAAGLVGCQPAEKEEKKEQGHPAQTYEMKGAWKNASCWFDCGGNCVNQVYVEDGVVMCDRTDGKGNGKHVTRYDQSHQRHMLISTCGFFSPKGNYDAVLAQFDLMLGVGNYTTLFCGEGEMMPVPPLQERVEEYLGYVRQAGEDYGSYGTILPKTRKPLEELLLPKEKFEEMGNSYYAHCERKARERALQAQAEQQT